MPLVQGGARLTTAVQRTMPFTPTIWFAVAYGKGVFVAPGYGSTYAARSTDGGLTWSQVTLPASRSWTTVATDGAGTWICTADGTNTGAISTDNGATWSAKTMPYGSTATTRTLAYGNGYWLCVVSGSTAAYQSSDASTWSNVTMPGGQSWQQAASDGAGKWVVVHVDVVSPKWYAYSTDDGQTFAKSGASPGPAYAVTYARDVFLAFNASATSLAGYSSDGSTWTTFSFTPTQNPAGASSGNGIAICPQYVSSNTATHYVSYDGKSIDTFTLPASIQTGLSAYGASRFVILVQSAVNYCYTIDVSLPRSASVGQSVTRSSVF